MYSKNLVDYVQDEKPNIFVSFNGDFFDWPFIRDRSKVYGIDLQTETGFREINGEFRGRSAGMTGLCV